MNWEPTSCSPIAPQGQKEYIMYLPYVMEIHYVFTDDLVAALGGDEVQALLAEWNEEDGWQPVFFRLVANALLH
jgi:hypothetical protein